MNGRVGVTVCIIAILALAAASVGCSDSNSASPVAPSTGGVVEAPATAEPTTDISGDWTFTSTRYDPIRISGCTGELARMRLDPCGDLSVNLSQFGATFSGSGPGACSGHRQYVDGSNVAGSVTGSILAPDTPDSTQMRFVGTVTGQTAVLRLTDLRIDRRVGECAMSGTLFGTRTDARVEPRTEFGFENATVH